MTLTYKSLPSLLNLEEISGCALMYWGNSLMSLSTVETKGVDCTEFLKNHQAYLLRDESRMIISTL